MTSKESRLFSIKCTHCAAPLEILGGGRVTTITCKYCNSILDITDQYKVIAQFQDKYRPPVPFTLGMRGKIKGVEWIIIGWVAYKTIDFPIERWSEFFLYSPLYGYGWLIYENGKLSFSKRVRDFALREWQEKKDPKSIFYRGGHYLSVEDPYIVEIDFVQGELSWIAKVDDRIRCWDYDGIKRRNISIERSDKEIEVYLNEQLDNKEVYDSFGVEKSQRVKEEIEGVDKIFDADSLDKREENISSFVKVISILLVVLLSAMISSLFIPKVLLKESSDRSFDQMITISSNAFISKIEIKAPTPNILNNSSFALYREGEKVFSIDKNHIFPRDRDFTYTWHKGDDGVTIYIKLQEGLYRVSFGLLKPLQSTTTNKVTISIEERVVRLIYILPLFIIMSIMLLPTIKRKLTLGGKQKFFWWGLSGIVGSAIFGFGIVIFIVAFYFFVQPILDGKKDWSSLMNRDNSDWSTWSDFDLGDD